MCICGIRASVFAFQSVLMPLRSTAHGPRAAASKVGACLCVLLRMGHGQLLQKLEHEISKFRLVECVQCVSSLSLQSAEEGRENERERESEREISTTWTDSQWKTHL